MPERTPLNLARMFVTSLVELQATPKENVPEKNLENSKEFAQVKKLINEAPISGFFRRQLIYEIRLRNIANGYIHPDFIFDEIVADYKIATYKGEAGIFDPEKAFKIEKDYFRKVKTDLQNRLENHIPNPVYWREWEADIIAREEQLNRR